MKQFSAKEFLKFQGIKLSGNSSASFKGLSYDSRNIRENNLFVALKGEKNDGNAFIERAFENGASVVLSSRNTNPPENKTLIFSEYPDKTIQDFASYQREKYRGLVIGVVGSTGKTTTKDFCAQFLSLYDLTYASEGNKNNLLGVPEAILNADYQAKYWVLEMGISLPSEMDSLAQIVKPNCVVFTNIKPVHTEFLKSPDNIFNEKSKVLKYLSPPSFFIYNRDDEYLCRLPEMFNFENYSFGFTKESDLKMTVLEEMGIEGFKVKFDFRKQSAILNLPFLNVANLYNFSASYLLSLIFYGDIGVGKQVLQKLTLSSHRGKIYKLKNGVTLYDDSYNSNPEAVKTLLSSCKSFKGKIVAILGEMRELGDESERYHREVGELSSQILTSLLCIGGQGAKTLYEEFRKTGKKCGYFKNWEEGKPFSDSLLEEGSLLIVKGSRAISLDRLVDEIINQIGVIE